MPTSYPAPVLRNAVNLSLCKLWWELMPTCYPCYPTHVLKGYCLPVPVGTDAHLLPCPCSKRMQPVPVQNFDGNWCPPVTLPMIWKDTVNLSLFKTLMGTDAHLLPCQWSEKILSTCPCSKLWWELMPTYYPAPVLWDAVNLSLCKTLLIINAHLLPVSYIPRFITKNRLVILWVIDAR
jgi:hypothetical protein